MRLISSIFKGKKIDLDIEDSEPPKTVSRWYNLDWQYVLKVGRTPALKPTAIIIAVAPIVGNIGQVTSISATGFWLMWGASVSSLVAFIIAFFACPRIIREDETYEDYEKKGHSHRWLVWLFYRNLESFPRPRAQLRELIHKQIAARCDEVGGVAVVPIMPAVAPDGERAQKPVNANRDLYMGFWRKRKRYVLTLEEDDPKLAEKSKELFWIIWSALLPSRPAWRFSVWAFYGLSLLLSGSALVLNLARPFWGVEEVTLSFGDRLAKALVILFGGSL